MATAQKEPKMTASEKRAQKRREAAEKAEQVFGTGRGSAEPIIDPDNYTPSLMRALNYYNVAFDNKTKRKWFMSYVGKKSTQFESLSDWDFRSVGTMIRLKQRGQPLSETHLAFIESTIADLSAKAKVERSTSRFDKKVEETEKPKVSIQERMVLAASEHAGEINGLIDEFILNGTEIDVSAYLKANDVSAPVSKHIPKWFNNTINELKEYVDGGDKQLTEGYSNLGKTKAKKLIRMLEAIDEACKQQAVSSKVARKPRVRKEKPASVIAAKVKYMREFAELNLKSEPPVRIVGASEVWIYNTKYKKLQVYRALGEGTLSIKGTTITNYEVATSGAKTIRKPEETLKNFVGLAKRSLGAEFKALKTKESAVNGRINEDSIIFRVF